MVAVFTAMYATLGPTWTPIVPLVSFEGLQPRYKTKETDFTSISWKSLNHF